MSNKIKKKSFLISEDDAYEIEGMLSVFILAFWEILENGASKYVKPGTKHEKFYNLLKKHIGDLY